MEVVVTIGAVRSTKTPVKSSPPTNQHPPFYRLSPSSLRLGLPVIAKFIVIVPAFLYKPSSLRLGPSSRQTNSIKALKGNVALKSYKNDL